MNPISRADVGVIPMWAVPTPVRSDGSEATVEGKPCLKQRSLPCSPALQTRMYQLQCQAGLGTAQAGPGWLDLPAVGGGSRGVGHTQDGTPPGARAPWLQRAGATGYDAGTQTHTRSRKAGSACSRAPGCVGGTGVTPGGLLCPLPHRPRTPSNSHGDARFPRSPAATCHCPREEGKAFLPPRGKTAVQRLCLRKCLALVFPTLLTSEGVKSEAKGQIIFCFIR